MEEKNFNQNTLKEDNELGHDEGLTKFPPLDSEPLTVPPVTEPTLGPVEPVVDSNRKSTLGELKKRVDKIYSELEGKNISDEAAETLANLINHMFRTTICDVTGLYEHNITDDVIRYVNMGVEYAAPVVEDGRVVGHTTCHRAYYDDELVDVILDYLTRQTKKNNSPVEPAVDPDRKSTLGELKKRIDKFYIELEGKNISDEAAETLAYWINHMFRKTICDYTGYIEHNITDDVVRYVNMGVEYAAPVVEDGRVVGHTTCHRAYYDDELVDVICDYLFRQRKKNNSLVEPVTESLPETIEPGVINSQDENSKSRSK